MPLSQSGAGHNQPNVFSTALSLWSDPLQWQLHVSLDRPTSTVLCERGESFMPVSSSAALREEYLIDSVFSYVFYHNSALAATLQIDTYRRLSRSSEGDEPRFLANALFDSLFKTCRDGRLILTPLSRGC